MAASRMLFNVNFTPVSRSRKFMKRNMELVSTKAISRKKIPNSCQKARRFCRLASII